jgi:hypothetical protein
MFSMSSMFEVSLNATFIFLIPKKTKSVDIKDFCPVSVVGGVYKIISKVLANMLKMVLGRLFSRLRMLSQGGDRF